MTPPILLDWIARTDDPLYTAVSGAPSSDAAARRELVDAAVARWGDKPSARAMQALARYARQAARQSSAQQEAAALVARGTRAARWTAASMLEASDAFNSAAALLAGLDDVSWSEERAMRLIALARTLQRAGRASEAWLPLRQAAAAADTSQSLTAIRQLLNSGGRDAAPARAARRIAVVGTGTLPLWSDAFDAALFGAGINAELFVGEFNQYQQEIVDPDSALAAFRPDLVVIAVDHRSLGLDSLADDPDAAVASAVARLRHLWQICQQRLGAAIVQFNFEVPEVDPFGPLSGLLPGGLSRVVQRINLALADRAREGNVTLFDLNEAAALFGRQRWSDAAMWIAAKQYPSAEAVPFLARRLAMTVRAVCGLTSKCVVLDLDNTLWGGIIGEDGLNGIRLGGDAEGDAYTAFHRYLLGLKERGIPLAVCSKNNEADALSVFREHPESILREDDFAVFLANWDPKPDNLRRIAGTLNLGIDSLVFVDDNPVERYFIRAELPEVEVPELPDDPAKYAESLHRSQLFDAVTFTDEDRGRAESYRRNAERSALASGSSDLDGYIASLGMTVELRPFDAPNLPRIVQLINKTNQFNLTTRRAAAADVERWMQDPDCYTRFMRLKDRFGDNGLTGVIVARREGDAVRIDTWLMSCRVLGRRVEDAMLASVFSYARGTGATRVIGEYLPTAKNGQVRDLYPRFGFDVVREDAAGGEYALAADRGPAADATLYEIDDTTLPTAAATGESHR